MNRKRIILVSFVLFLVIRLFGQRVEFQYDDNGNRTNRTIIVEQLKSDIKFPITDPKQLVTQRNTLARGLEVGSSVQPEDAIGKDDMTRERIKTEKDEIAALVYPNPNKGLIKIDISNMPTTSINEIRLYDLNGNELTVRKDFENHLEIDISQFKDGIYILRIKINDKRFDFKIIKG